MITDMKNAKIFSPLQLGRTTLKNRIAMAPMSMHYEATNGTVPKQLADIFVRRAEGGAGYVVIDAVTVDHKYWYIGKTTALDKDSLVPQFAAFAKRVSDAGSTLIPQIIHPGPESICALKGITPLGPSVNTNANGAVSRPITIDEIHKVVKQYGQAARRAEEAGCGGIALHCAHAYMLPGAFLSPLRNKRMDEYGGCIDNRARLILEIIEECRRNISRDFPIVLRVSGSEREPGGNSLDEMLYLAPKFEAAGVDMLEVSGGVQYEGLQNILPSHSQKIGMNVYEASEIKKVVNIPVSLSARSTTCATPPIWWSVVWWMACPWAVLCSQTPTCRRKHSRTASMTSRPAAPAAAAASRRKIRIIRSASAISTRSSVTSMTSRSTRPTSPGRSSSSAPAPAACTPLSRRLSAATTSPSGRRASRSAAS